MKIILHMGQGKTGTSSLQQALHAASGDLRRRGVLYPKFAGGQVTHQLLLALIGSEDRLPPWSLERLGGAQAATEAARRAWDRMCDDIRRDRPELLILSSEFLISRTTTEAKARLAELLRSLSTDITPVLYIRHPVDRTRALLQQSLKHWDNFKPQAPDLLRHQILDAEAAFARRPEFVAFDRGVLHGNDIVKDFATRFLGPAVQPADLSSPKVNISLSAEALMLLLRLRAEAGGGYEVSRRMVKLVPALEVLDRSDPPTAPFALLPEVAEAFLRSSVSHRWLAETGRLQIPGLDIGRIDGAALPDWIRSAKPESLFRHDPERLDRLQQTLLPEVARIRQGNIPPNPSAKPIRRISDLVLRFVQTKLASVQDKKTK